MTKGKVKYFILRGFWKLLRSFVDRKFLVQYEVERSVGKFGKGLKVNNTCTGFHKGVIIHDYVNFNGLRIIGKGGVEFGSYFHSGENITIITSNHNYDDPEVESIPYGKKRINKDVTIKDFVWLGHGVTILPGITIGEGVVVAAGSVVVKDIPDYMVVGGNPAKVLKSRNVEQFQRLKSEGKFL